jgi:hypothetical protein
MLTVISSRIAAVGGSTPERAPPIKKCHEAGAAQCLSKTGQLLLSR